VIEGAYKVVHPEYCMEKMEILRKSYGKIVLKIEGKNVLKMMRFACTLYGSGVQIWSGILRKNTS